MTKSLFELLEEEKLAVEALHFALKWLCEDEEKLANIDAEKLSTPEAPNSYWEYKKEWLEETIAKDKRDVEKARKTIDDVRKQMKEYISMITSL